VRFKRLREMVHPSSAVHHLYRLFHAGGDHDSGEFDYHSRVGTGVSSSVLMAPIQWVQRAIIEAPLIVDRLRGDEAEIVPEHAAAKLLERPNPHYSGAHLLHATVFSYLTDGNAYWAIVRNGAGQPARLWWLPHWLVTPKWPDGGSEFISHYEYRVGGEKKRLEVDDVVHIRHGVNPHNPRKGVSPVHSAIRAIWADMEAEEFIASMLRNQGMPGLVISPDGDVEVGEDDMQEFKNYIEREFGGSNRGKPLVASAKTKVDRVSWSPREMDLTAATDRFEERVCALLGIPAAVVGFSAGLQQTKVGATMGEMRELAWLNGIIPIQENIQGEINNALLPLFRRSNNLRVRFDRSDVAALADDRNALVTRLNTAVQGGWMTVAAAKREMGIEPENGDDVYLRGLNILSVPIGRSGPTSRPAPAGGGSDDDGGDDEDKSKARRKDCDHTPFEHRMTERERREATEGQRRFMVAQESDLPGLEDMMRERLMDFLTNTLGARAVEASGPVLEERFKQTAEDESIVERIMQAMAMEGIIETHRQIYEAVYLEVANATAAHMDMLGLATDLPDPVQRAILATGGRRAGLVDLNAQTRDRLFRALETARAEGEGVDAIVRRIRDDIPAGRWSSAELRARTIARTETKHAQRASSIEMARSQGSVRMRIFDDRTGFSSVDPSHDICQDLDGRVVSVEEAEELMALEHPNGTRDAVPIIE